MANYPANKIKNICLMGHGSAGKTSLAEAMLYSAGEIDRLGNITDGSTVMDYDPEEVKRSFSISTSVAPLDWKQNKINIVDTPGYFDFVGGIMEGIRGADTAVIVISGKSGIDVGTEKAWDYAKEVKMPVSMIITKMDDERANFNNFIDEMRQKFGSGIIPFAIPIKTDGKLTAVADVISKKVYSNKAGKTVEEAASDDILKQISTVSDMLIEAVAETDEELMEKFFEGEEFTDEEMEKGIKIGIKDRSIIPVYCADSISQVGISVFMDSIAKFIPSAQDMGEIEAVDKNSGDKVKLTPSENETLAALVFKTVADPYVGKLSIFRVYSGVIKPDSVVYNSNSDSQEKIGHIFTIKGKKQTDINQIGAGDIGATTKLLATSTGDTLCSPSKPVILERVSFPNPVISLAILPEQKGDEEKIGSGLAKLGEEDPSFKITNNAETHQTLIEGQGEQHLSVIVSKLKTKYGVSVKLEDPIVPYRETIRGKVKAEGKHKKQSGGHGQYGHVWIEFESSESNELEFCESVFGGAVPKNYFPAVEKGLRECMEHGVLAGYPVVNLKATLYDGSYHPVDSSEMAFKIAASLAFKNGLSQAKPVLLEPIGYLKAQVPDSLMGDIIGDINKRRGRILGMGSGSVEAEVPMAEMFKYATDLRSMTQGRGSFSFEFVRYDEAPSNVAQKIIEDSKSKADNDK